MLPADWNKVFEQVPALALFVVMAIGIVRFLSNYLTKRDEMSHTRDSTLLHLVLEAQTTVQKQAEVFAERVKEHSALHTRLLSVMDENSKALNNNAHALEEMRRAIGEVREALTSVEHRVDNLRTPPRV